MKLQTQPAIRSGGEAVEIGDLLRSLVESRAFNAAIIAVIVINAVALGLETWPAAMDAAGPLLIALDSTGSRGARGLHRRAGT